MTCEPCRGGQHQKCTGSTKLPEPGPGGQTWWTYCVCTRCTPFHQTQTERRTRQRFRTERQEGQTS